MNEYELSRWSGWREKEPETVAWIESMAPGGVFYDVGASVGTYSLFAARRGLKVYSFEPHPPTFASLWEMVVTRGLDITPLCVSLGSNSGMDLVSYRNLAAGSQGLSHANRGPVIGSAPMPFVALDEAVGLLGLRQPNHIKIDIDGGELDAVNGMVETLRRADSVLIETNADRAPLEIIRSLGFALHPTLNDVPGHSKHRRASDPGNDSQNWIMVKP